MCSQMLAMAGKMQQASSFSLSIKTWPLERAISITQTQCPFCVSHPRGTLLTTHLQHLLAEFPSMRLKEKSITSILSIISCCSGLWISPAPRAVSPESWLTMGGSRGQRGYLSVVGKLCLPLPTVPCWAYGNNAPEYAAAGWIIKDLQLRSFHTVQSASRWTANLILKDTLRYSLWTGFVLEVLSFVCNFNFPSLFTFSGATLCFPFSALIFLLLVRQFPSLWHAHQVVGSAHWT